MELYFGGFKKIKDSQGQLSTLKFELFSLEKQESRECNTESAEMCYLHHWMFAAIRFWFSFSYPKVACDPINQHERMQQRRLRAHVSHTDVGLYLPISPQLSISLLISLRSWLNTRVLILVWGQIWNIWGWIIDAIPPLQWAFCARQVLTKFTVMITVTVFVISRPVYWKIPLKSATCVSRTLLIYSFPCAWYYTEYIFLTLEQC